MSYTDFIEKVRSKKITLFELDAGKLFGDNLWVKDVPGVWKTTYSWVKDKPITTTAYGIGTWGAGIYGITSSTTLPVPIRDIAQIIGSLEINGDNYTLVSSLSSVATTIDSFYWDALNQVLYVNYPGYIRDTTNIIIVGLTFGYSTIPKRFNNIFYEGLIKTIPSITVKQDNLFKSVVTFEGGQVVLENTHGAFDNFEEKDIYGKRMRIKFGGDDLPYDEYKDVYTGYIEKFDTSRTLIPINVKDERKNLQRKIPNNYYSSTTYPDIDSGNIGSGIGIGYGDINRARAICTNEEASVSTYNFKFVDTSLHNIVSIDQVYVEGIKVAHSNGSITSGTFDLSSSVYQSGQKVAVSFQGYNIVNPLDIIEDLLWIYSDIPYTSDFYNTTDWDALKLTLPDINLYVTEKTLIQIIGDISSSIFGSLIIEGDGRINMKVVNLTKTPVKTIRRREYLEDINKVRNSDAYISSAKVGYRKSWNNNSFSYFINDTEEEALVKRFRSYKEQVFKTLLTNESDASDFSNTAMTLFGGITPEYTIKTKIQNIDVELEDLIIIDVSRYKDVEKLVTVEIISKNVDYTNNIITFICRKI